MRSVEIVIAGALITYFMKKRSKRQEDKETNRFESQERAYFMVSSQPLSLRVRFLLLTYEL